MPEIQRPDITRNIEKRYGIKGYPAAGVLSPEIVPVTLVDDISGVDDRERHPYFGTVAQAAGGAGTYATVNLYNPASSGAIIDGVQLWVITGAGSGLIYMRRNVTATLTNTATTFKNLDGRSTTLATADMQYEALGATITGEFAIQVAGGLSSHFTFPAILDEGNSIYVQHQGANDSLLVSFLWSERPRTVEDADIP